MNFSRICHSSLVLHWLTKMLNLALSTYRRNYLTVEQFNQNLESIDKTQKQINTNSVPLTNKNLIES